MTNKMVMIAGATCFALLAACDDTSTSSASAELTPAQQACLRDVANTTNNSQVVVLSSAFSEAGTQVTVGVGEDRVDAADIVAAKVRSEHDRVLVLTAVPGGGGRGGGRWRVRMGGVSGGRGGGVGGCTSSV